MRQLRKKLIQLLLALIQLTAASVVDSKEGHDAIDDEETILISHEELSNLVQELHLMLGVDSTSVSDIVLGFVLSARCKDEHFASHSLVSGSRPKRSAI